MVGLLLCLAALLACGGGGNVWSRRTAPWTYRIGCEGSLEHCYDEAARLCRYGYDVAGETENVTGARSQTTVIGNNAFTKVKASREGGLLVECRKPIFCETGAECAGTGLVCVKSVKYPGRNVCGRAAVD
jgi:hypothetical protein